MYALCLQIQEERVEQPEEEDEQQPAASGERTKACLFANYP